MRMVISNIGMVATRAMRICRASSWNHNIESYTFTNATQDTRRKQEHGGDTAFVAHRNAHTHGEWKAEKTPSPSPAAAAAER